MHIRSCLFSLISSGLLVTSRCILSLCPALSCLDVLIKYYYYLSLYPRLRVLVPPSCVHCDRRPDLNRKRRPFTPFCFPLFSKVFVLVPVCLSRGMEVAARYSRHSTLQVGVGVRRDRRECRESTGREPSCPPIAGDHATGPPLTQCQPARLWLNARRIAADSCPPDRRWLMPARSALTHARRPPLSLAPWIKSTCHGQECRVSVLLCPQEHFKELCLVLSTATRLGQASPLVVAMEAILVACPPVVDVEAVAEGPCEGPWCHAQRKPQLPSQPRRASCSCGLSCPVPVCLAPEGCPVLSCSYVFSPGGLSMYCPVCLAPEGSLF